MGTVVNNHWTGMVECKLQVTVHEHMQLILYAVQCQIAQSMPTIIELNRILQQIP